MTVRSMVTALAKQADLFVLPISEIDFQTGKFQAYKRIAGGKFRRHAVKKPDADLWIVYTDGYYLDIPAMGYRRRLDYFNDQLQYYSRLISDGLVAHMVNTPAAERNTLKDWFAKLDADRLRVIPTFTLRDERDLRSLHKRHGTVVLKPNWGGAGMSVRKLEKDADIAKAVEDLTREGEFLSDYVVQVCVDGPEKRLWFAGDEFVGGRICHGRKTPWSDSTDDYASAKYEKGSDVQRDLQVARQVWRLAGLSLGSVDFIGDQINEINGAGTIYTYYHYWTKIADARKPLVDYLVSLLNT